MQFACLPATSRCMPRQLLSAAHRHTAHAETHSLHVCAGIADIEANTAKELTKLGGVIQVPFRAGNQFLGEGGIQDVFYNVVSTTRCTRLPV